MNLVATQTDQYCFEISKNVLLASWNDALSVESAEFLASLEHLFWIASEYGVCRVLIDSGKPAGGVLTEELISFVQETIKFIKVEKIALLETTDFFWDNNLFQFLQYLKMGINADMEIKLFFSRPIAIDWLEK